MKNDKRERTKKKGISAVGIVRLFGVLFAVLVLLIILTFLLMVSISELRITFADAILLLGCLLNVLLASFNFYIGRRRALIYGAAAVFMFILVVIAFR